MHPEHAGERRRRAAAGASATRPKSSSQEVAHQIRLSATIWKTSRAVPAARLSAPSSSARSPPASCRVTSQPISQPRHRRRPTTPPMCGCSHTRSYIRWIARAKLDAEKSVISSPAIPVWARTWSVVTSPSMQASSPPGRPRRPRRRCWTASPIRCGKNDGEHDQHRDQREQSLRGDQHAPVDELDPRRSRGPAGPGSGPGRPAPAPARLRVWYVVVRRSRVPATSNALTSRAVADDPAG